jgi:hypothetical protein
MSLYSGGEDRNLTYGLIVEGKNSAESLIKNSASTDRKVG